MRNTLFIGAIVLGSFVTLAGCYDPNAQRSAIVRQVEAAGSGNISTYTYPGLAEWFSYRPALAVQIAQECAVIAPTRPASWTTSAEGTACHAAASMQPPPVLTADKTTF